MQIKIGTSKSLIYDCPENLIESLILDFTYTNTSISFQVFTHKKNRQRIISRLAATIAMNRAEAESMWREQLIEVSKGLKVSLVKMTQDKLIVFPTGLLEKILDFFDKNGFSKDQLRETSIIDYRVKPKETNGFPIAGKPAQLRPYQETAVKELLSHGQGTFVGSTGSGKTLVIQEVIRRLGLKTVVVVPNISILNQTVKRFEKYFGTRLVGKLGDGKRVLDKKITVACAASVALTTADDWKNIDVAFFDETHHAPCKTIETIAYKVFPNAFYRFGATATCFRTDGADLAIEAAVFPPVFQYTLEDGIKDGFLATPSTIMYHVPFNSYRNYSGKIMTYAYKYHVFRNHKLTNYIVQQINSYLDQGKQILILVREKEQGFHLQSKLPGAAFVHQGPRPEKLGPAPEPVYKKSTAAVEDFNKGKLRCLIATSILGEGSDLPPVDVLFNLSGGKSKLDLMQHVGRGLRKTETKKELIVVDYIHATHDLLKKHSIERYKWYQTIGKVELKELH